MELPWGSEYKASKLKRPLLERENFGEKGSVVSTEHFMDTKRKARVLSTSRVQAHCATQTDRNPKALSTPSHLQPKMREVFW